MSSLFETYRQTLKQSQPLGVSGRVSGVRGLSVSVSDFAAPLGAGCRIVRGERGVEGRVVGFAGGETLIMPMGPMAGICRGDRVVLASSEQTVGVGAEMLGRVVDSLGRPIDGRGSLRTETRMPIWPEPIAPMQRQRIADPLATGVRAIDAMLTVGRGQRMGIFSGSGVGKSVLLGMIGRYTSADVTVIGLIGERGREIRDFVERDLGPEGLKRSVIIATTSDQPPLVRVQAGAVATAVAEFFRNQGLDVLLLIDSLSRLASAQRQIGLAAGEPPTTKGYTPSVFNLLPELLERAGRTKAGSITGFYTVLAEGDDLAEPVSDAVRAVTDGHIFLSRDLANRGHYPAVDCLQSVSRVMRDVTSAEHREAAKEIQRQIATYSDIEELVNVGAYQAGASEEYDLAIEAMPMIRRFLAQGIAEPSALERTRDDLRTLHEWIVGRKESLAARQAQGRREKARRRSAGT
jgi:flagellum-specific ATP synthase